MLGRLTPAVKTLLLVNLVVHLVVYISKSKLGIDLYTLGGLHYITGDNFGVHQFFTYMFLHSYGDLWHLIGNMFGLFIFGPILEQEWGSKRFMTYYIITGLGAGILFMGVDYYEVKQLEHKIEIYADNPGANAFYDLMHKNPELVGEDSKAANSTLKNLRAYPGDPVFVKNSLETISDGYWSYINGKVMVGASGAIFGLILAMALLFPNLQFFLLFPPIPVKMKYLALFYGLYSAYQLYVNAPGDNVAHLAHLGGMLVGFIMIKIWYGRNYRIY